MAKRKRCPVLRWEVHDSEGFTAEGLPHRYTEVFGYSGDTRLVKGELTDDPTLTRRGTLMVAYSYTHQDYRRCGFGTKLYEKLRDVACQRGKKLASDTTRTRFSEGFWQKQLRKGRAKCLMRPRAWQRKGGEIPEDSDCGQYAMRAACPTAGQASLAGRRKKRQRR